MIEIFNDIFLCTLSNIALNNAIITSCSNVSLADVWWGEQPTWWCTALCGNAWAYSWCLAIPPIRAQLYAEGNAGKLLAIWMFGIGNDWWFKLVWARQPRWVTRNGYVLGWLKRGPSTWAWWLVLATRLSHESEWTAKGLLIDVRLD